MDSLRRLLNERGEVYVVGGQNPSPLRPSPSAKEAGTAYYVS